MRSTRSNIAAIAKIQLKALEARLAKLEIRLDVSDAALKRVAEAGFDPVYGARPLKRAIQQQIENPLAKEILAGKYAAGDTCSRRVAADRFGRRDHVRATQGHAVRKSCFRAREAWPECGRASTWVRVARAEYGACRGSRQKYEPPRAADANHGERSGSLRGRSRRRCPKWLSSTWCASTHTVAVALRFDQREAAAVDRVGVAGRQHDVPLVVLERDPQPCRSSRAASCRARRPACTSSPGGELQDLRVSGAEHGQPPVSCVHCIRWRPAWLPRTASAAAQICAGLTDRFWDAAGAVQTVFRNVSHDSDACIRRCGGCRRSTSCGLRGRRARLVVHARRGGTLRHAVGAVAPGAGARGGARRAAVRARASRARADAGRRRVSPRRDRGTCARSRRAAEAARGGIARPGLTVSTTVSFASLWVIPRLASFRARHPDVEVYVSADDRLIDLGRGEVDVAVRYLADASAPRRRGAALRRAHAAGGRARARATRGGAPLKQPADLARHVLLHLDDPDGRMPWLDWPAWLAVERAARPEARGIAALHALRPGDPGGARRAGRRARAAFRSLPSYLRDGRLIAPFPEALRLGARLLRRRRAARGRARRTSPASSTWLRRRGRRASSGRRKRGRNRPGAEPPSPAATPASSASQACPHRIAAHPHVGLRALALDRALCAARPGGRARARSRVRARPPRALLRGARRAASSPSTATPRRWPRWPASRGIETRAGRSRGATRGRSQASASTRSSSANYLHRPLLPLLLAALADDGVLLYETFARGNEAYGRPSNPDFLLRAGRTAAVCGRAPRH